MLQICLLSCSKIVTQMEVNIFERTINTKSNLDLHNSRIFAQFGERTHDTVAARTPESYPTIGSPRRNPAQNCRGRLILGQI